MVRPELGQHNFQKSSPVDRFQKLELLAQGTCSQVFKAKELQTGETVAVKKIRIENETEGCPMTTLHEIQALNKLCHENIIKLKETLDSPGAVYLVLEYMDHDLSGLARRAGKFSAAQIKCYMKQLLAGLHHCHVNHILHRDIKGFNILTEKWTRQMNELLDSLQFPLSEEKEAEVRERVEELKKLFETLKEGLYPLERQVREVFHRIVRSRTEELDSLNRGGSSE